MRERQHGRLAFEVTDAPHGQTGQDTGAPSPQQGGISSELQDSLKDGRDGEFSDSIERATAVLGDDAGDAS